MIGGNATHFGSKDIYYSYGKKFDYGMVNNLSVGQYSSRPYVNSPLKKEKSYFNAVMMEEVVSYELCTGITRMTRIIPNITKLIDPIINTTFILLEEKGNVNFQKIPSSEDSSWQIFISINARTS